MTFFFEKDFSVEDAIKNGKYNEEMIKSAFHKFLDDDELDIYKFENLKIPSLVIQGYFRDIYGPDIAYKPETLTKYFNCDIEYINYDFIYGSFNFIPQSCGGIEEPYLYEFDRIPFKAEQFDNTITVYYYVYHMISVGDENNPHSCEIYNERTNFLLLKKDKLCSEEILTEMTEELIKENKLPVYKAKFKKQSDGNYYFYEGKWQ